MLADWSRPLDQMQLAALHDEVVALRRRLVLAERHISTLASIVDSLTGALREAWLAPRLPANRPAG